MHCRQCGHKNVQPHYIEPVPTDDPAERQPILARWACEQCSRDHWPDGTLCSTDVPANADMIEGFRDGYDLDSPTPSANRSASYRHGFANGRDDVLHKRPRDTYENLVAQAEAAMAADADQ